MPVITLTGAAGGIGTALRAGVAAEGETWRLLDVRPIDAPTQNEEAVTVDLADLDATVDAIAGSAAVVHLAAQAGDTDFDDILERNVVATYNVFEAARRTGARRVVFASSVHATGFYPWGEVVSPADPVRPDSLYGVSKVYGETLGRLYADKYGLEVVCVRIGSFVPEPSQAEHLSSWFSPGDAVRLFRGCLDAPAVGHLVLYGISACPRPLWTDDGWATIGYEPQDDPRRHLDRIADPDAPAPAFHGMDFAERGLAERGLARGAADPDRAAPDRAVPGRPVPAEAEPVTREAP